MIGVDEVGRGAWAGPLLVVAARLKSGCIPPNNIKDSKLLSIKQRNTLYPLLIETFDIGKHFVDAEEIDAHGLAQALKTATLYAVEDMGALPSEPICIDGSVNFLKDSVYVNSYQLVRAENQIVEVAAALIFAKVLRDQFMINASEAFPGYGFERHVGYGTSYHREMIAKYGVCQLHRLSIKPLARYAA